MFDHLCNLTVNMRVRTIYRGTLMESIILLIMYRPNITLETFPDENDHICIPCGSEELALNFHKVVQECVRQENRFYGFDVIIL